jgi:hypothetical protein
LDVFNSVTLDEVGSFALLATSRTIILSHHYYEQVVGDDFAGEMTWEWYVDKRQEVRVQAHVNGNGDPYDEPVRHVPAVHTFESAGTTYDAVFVPLVSHSVRRLWRCTVTLHSFAREPELPPTDVRRLLAKQVVSGQVDWVASCLAPPGTEAVHTDVRLAIVRMGNLLGATTPGWQVFLPVSVVYDLAMDVVFKHRTLETTRQLGYKAKTMIAKARIPGSMRARAAALAVALAEELDLSFETAIRRDLIDASARAEHSRSLTTPGTGSNAVTVQVGRYTWHSPGTLAAILDRRTDRYVVAAATVLSCVFGGPLVALLACLSAMWAPDVATVGLWVGPLVVGGIVHEYVGVVLCALAVAFLRRDQFHAHPGHE